MILYRNFIKQSSFFQLCICVKQKYKSIFPVNNNLKAQNYTMALMKSPEEFKEMLENRGISKKNIDEIWKWYDSSEKHGVASF